MADKPSIDAYTKAGDATARVRWLQHLGDKELAALVTGMTDAQYSAVIADVRSADPRAVLPSLTTRVSKARGLAANSSDEKLVASVKTAKAVVDDPKATQEQKRQAVATAQADVAAAPVGTDRKSDAGARLQHVVDALSQDGLPNPFKYGNDTPMGNATGQLPTVHSQVLPGNTVEEMWAAFLGRASSDPTFLAQVQQQMLYAGLYPQGAQPAFGVFTQADRNAFGEVLHNGAMSGTDPFQMLSHLAQTGATQGVDTARAKLKQDTSFTVTHEDRNAIAQMVEQQGQSILGRKPSEQEKRLIYSILDRANVASQMVPINAKMKLARDAYQQAIQQYTKAPTLDTGTARTPTSTGSPFEDAMSHQARSDAPQPGWVPGVAAPVDPNSAPPSDGGGMAGFLSNIGGAVQNAVTQVQAAGGPGAMPGANITDVTNVDPTADAAALLRSRHPAEAGAHDVAQQFSTFLNILEGIR